MTSTGMPRGLRRVMRQQNVQLSLVAVPIAMAKKDTPANDKTNTLYLYEKDANWDIVWNGAWGMMSFDLTDTTIDCVFNGHGLEKGTDYSLISYDGWPNVTVIASGTSNNGGNINLKGSTDLDKSEGIYIWLIESGDLTGTEINTWPLNGTVLWEHNEIPNPDISDPGKGKK